MIEAKVGNLCKETAKQACPPQSKQDAPETGNG